MRMNGLSTAIITITTAIVFFTGSAKGTELGTIAQNLAPGSWAQMTSPGNFFVQEGASTTTLHFMGQGTWDSIGKQVVFLGAPHGGNSKLHIYDDSTNAWREGTRIPGYPTNWVHGYNHNAISVSDRIMGFLLARNDLTFNEYNLDTQTWAIKGSTSNDGGLAHALVYFPERSRWYVPDGTFGKLREYDHASDTWSVFDQNMACYGPASGGYYHQFATYNPVYHTIAFGGGNTSSNDFSTSWCTMDVSGTLQVMPASPHTLRIPDGGNPTNGALITTDPISGDLVVLTQTGILYRFDFTNNQWFTVDDSTTRPPFFNKASDNVTSAFVVPIDTYGVIMYGRYNGDNTEIWVYKHSANGGLTPPPPPTSDTEPPSTPQGLTIGAVSSTQTTLLWSSSSDNVGVTGYEIYRNNAIVGTVPIATFQDSGLLPSTTYTYSVVALDAAGNHSSNSSPIQVTTSAPQTTVVSSSGEPNKITIFETSGSTQTNRPVSIARPFRQGDIPDFAQAKIGTAAVLTQCDVKNRWPDGSLKFAIVSFLVPSLPANGSVEVEFINQPTGNNTGFLDQSQMLSAEYDFDGLIQMTGTSSQTVSARTMLGAGSFRYWLKGPIVTAVLIEDRTPLRTYDKDFGDGSKALHPIFEAWFYPATKDVLLGYTIENIWASNDPAKSMRDLTYSITIKSGNTNPQIEWSHGTFNHIGRTRWHKTFWIGSDPQTIRVDHSLPYLVTSGAIPHFDTNLNVDSAIEDSRYSTFQQYNGTLDGSDGGNPERIGNYSKAMNGGGAADWIGLLNTWEVLWLYSMSDKGYEMVLGNADLAGRMPFHFREADSLAGSGDYFDQSYTQTINLSTPGSPSGTGTVDTFGRVISINARRTTHLSTYSDSAQFPEDRIQTGLVTNDGWGGFGIERNHEPNVCYLAYLFSGQYYYLECLQMQAAFNIAWKTAGWGSDWARPGDVGLLNDTNIRGDAWGLKSVVYGAFLSPDGEPEQAYFLDKLKDNIAEWEGAHNLPLTYPSKLEIWNYGKNVRTQNGSWMLPNGQASPLGQWSAGDGSFIQSPLSNDGSLLRATSPWEEGFLLCILGMANQMRVADTSTLLKFMAKKKFHLNLDTIADPNTNLINFGEAYRDPTIESATGNWVQTWDAFVSHYQKSIEPYTKRRDNLTTDHSYAFISLAGDSFLTSYTVDGFNGTDAYLANKASTPHQDRFSSESPKWAITPFNTPSTSPPDTIAPSPPSNLNVN